MAEFTPITTQEQLDAVLKDRLDREKRKYDGFISPSDFDEKKKAYEQKIADLTKDANEKAQKYATYDKDIAERDAKIKGYETSALKSKIANEFGLSYDAIGYLSGDTEESIRTSAEGLKKLLGVPKVPGFNPDLMNNDKDSSTDAIKKLAHALSE